MVNCCHLQHRIWRTLLVYSCESRSSSQTSTCCNCAEHMAKHFESCKLQRKTLKPSNYQPRWLGELNKLVMFRQVVKLGQQLASLNLQSSPTARLLRVQRELWPQATSLGSVQHFKQFHAAGSKVHYLDFRHRFRTNHLRLHLIIIRKQKMKKHRRRKFKKKFKCLLAKQRLKKEIAKEKAFRVELLSAIRLAENFDPKEYALRKIAEENNKPRELSREEKLEQLKELIRKNRYQTTYIKPNHFKADI